MTTAPSFDGTQPCMKVDPEIFFPEIDVEIGENGKEKRPTSQALIKYKIAVATAKEICTDCPFVAPCLDYAIKTTAYGIWGATDEKDRRRIKKTRKLQKSTP